MTALHFVSNPSRSRPLFLLAAAWMVLALPLAFGQATAPTPSTPPQAEDVPAKPLAFDAVSIRLNKSVGQGGWAQSTPDGFTSVNFPLMGQIGPAYGVEPDQVYGLPGWAESNRYDIQAKVAGEDVEAYRKLGREQKQLMLRAVFEDRLKLKVHLGTKEVPMYQMVIARNGPKLHEAKPGDTYPDGLKAADGTPIAGPGYAMRPGQFTSQQIPVSALLNSLKAETGRTVIDKTGLTGKYDITLLWTPDHGRASGDVPPADTGPSIFSALEEQLGLKLELTKGSIKTLTIDHIDPPSEN